MEAEIKNKLKRSLSEKRYIHSLGVADEAKRLAARYGANEEKAYIAGLLHDCAKEMDEPAKRCRDLGVELDDIMKVNKGLIHGPLGAEIARLDFGINDEAILDAIRWHTVGKAGMTLLEKIIYIADMTEKNRNFDGVEEIREAVSSDLDRAILLEIEQHLQLLEKKGATIHPNTILLRNDLILNKGERRNEH